MLVINQKAKGSPAKPTGQGGLASNRRTIPADERPAKRKTAASRCSNRLNEIERIG
ncbi:MULTISPECIES: hypothetical protein [Burkholderia]|uniref:hypothetical protein n=1 Tax=Burkholderia TaxID=32008 RepID=UPI001FC8B433|nr:MULTISPECIES: hypothetical protein [Burkholderia]